MKDVVVFDLDGTLACGKHRLHLLPKPEDAHRTEAWDAFNLACAEDSLIEDNEQILSALSDCGYEIVILTGRSDVAYRMTVTWLEGNGVYYDQLIMRPRDDHRKDIEFKEEKLREIGLEHILCCFDDLEHVVKHIRSLGVTCHQVTHYDTPRVDTTQRNS